MTLTPIKFEDIPHSDFRNRKKATPASDTTNSECIAFLAMGSDYCKTNVVGKKEVNRKRELIKKIVKKNAYPIRAFSRNGVLYLEKLKPVEA